MDISEADYKRMHDLASIWRTGVDMSLSHILSSNEKRDIKFLLSQPDQKIIQTVHSALSTPQHAFLDVHDMLAQLLKTWDIFTVLAENYKRSPDKGNFPIRNHLDICILFSILYNRSLVGILPSDEQEKKWKAKENRVAAEVKKRRDFEQWCIENMPKRKDESEHRWLEI